MHNQDVTDLQSVKWHIVQLVGQELREEMACPGALCPKLAADRSEGGRSCPYGTKPCERHADFKRPPTSDAVVRSSSTAWYLSSMNEPEV